MSNDHISEYLKYYFDLKGIPHYAVMLSGEWGSGKTWYINKLMDDYTKEKSVKEKSDIFLYISLYGMKDTAEINVAIFQNIHPILKSKPAAIAGSLLRGAAKMKFDLNLDAKVLSKMVKSNADKIMVFDDVERCHIPHQELFGYLNGFIEHQNQKVILVSHEDELFSDNEEKLRRYKEKIIGRTFKVESNIDEAFASFVRLVDDEKHRDLLFKYQETVFLVYEKVGKNNLRNLRQAIISFPYFLKQFPNGMIEILETRDTELEYIVKSFFFIYLEEKGGAVNEGNWREAFKVFHLEGIGYSDFYIYDALYSHDFLGDDWYDIIIQGMNYSSQLSVIFENMKEEERSNPKAVWVLYKNLGDLSKVDFKNAYKELLSDIQNDKIENIGELFQAYGILLHLSKNKTIKKSIDNINKIIRKNLKTNTHSGKYEIVENHDFPDRSHGYLQRYESDSDETKEMHAYLRQIQDKVDKDRLTHEFQTLISNLKDNLQTICNEIVFAGHRGKFSKKPFFSYIRKKEKFFNSVCVLPTREMNYFMRTLEERYSLVYSNGQVENLLLPEVDFVNDFYTFIEKKMKKESAYLNPSIAKYGCLLEDLSKVKEQLKKNPR